MKTIPTQVASVYEELKSEVTWLHGRWIIYRQLFGESARRIAMLNDCASAFFFILQNVLLGEIQIALSKLTDPATTGKHENLSLKQLQKRLEKHADKALSDETHAILNALCTKCGPFRAWRNKQLAHLDLSTSMKSSADPLPGISRQMVEDALSLLRDFMNKIEEHYLESEMGYEHFIMSSDGNALLSIIRSGLRYEALVKQGTIPMDDWLRSEWKDA